jgi:hypothetical protein
VNITLQQSGQTFTDKPRKSDLGKIGVILTPQQEQRERKEAEGL